MSERPSRFARRKAHDPITRRDEALAFVAGDDTWRAPDWFARLAVVLVEPTDPVNIGGVIRAMANTGFLNLRLVRPVGFRPWDVIGVAHYTQHIVDSTQQFDSLPSAVHDRHLVIGLTGRHHRVVRNAVTLPEAVERMVQAAQSGENVAVVLGREDRGLSNDMLDACHMVTTIPTNPGFPSLNLAQAALLVLYQLFQRSGGQEQSFRAPRRSSGPAHLVCSKICLPISNAPSTPSNSSNRARASIRCARCAWRCIGRAWTCARRRCCAPRPSKCGGF